MDDSDPDRETFDPLVDIDTQSIIQLATKIAKRHLQLSSSGIGEVVSCKFGSFNIVHIVKLKGTTTTGTTDPKLVIRLPATGWGPNRTSLTAEFMKSQAATMRLILEKTAIPVPEIYAMDTTNDNEIGAPYMCMSFLPGQPVSEVWFAGYGGPSSREGMRLRILTSVSKAMAQLSCLRFDSLGSVTGSPSNTPTSTTAALGPLYDWDEKANGSFQILASGPYDSIATYIQQQSLDSGCDTVWSRAEQKIFKSLLTYLLTVDVDNTYVLCHPDFDSQNILVDDQGYPRYPSWITRDWDPLMYGWPKMAESEDSPQALEKYRAYYNLELGKALEWRDGWEYTKHSHMYEAIWIALNSPMNRLEICRKFVDAALASTEEDFDALGTLYDIGIDEYSEDNWAMLQTRLKGLFGSFKGIL